MSPIVFRAGGLHFGWFASDAGEPVHVHVFRGGRRASSAKFWITEDGLVQAHNDARLSDKEINDACRFIAANRDMFVAEWNAFFDID